eukprot:529281_1
MSTFFVFGISIMISTRSQIQNCYWGDFSLQGVQGYEIQCIDNDFAIGYTPCMEYALCNGERYQAVYFNRNNQQCLYYLAEWHNGETEPIFENDDGLYLWTFPYTNGQSCSGAVRQFDITWECDPNAEPFSWQTICGTINECHQWMTIRSVYACVEGTTTTTTHSPEDGCVWEIDDNKLNLTLIQGFVLNHVSDNDPEQIYSLSSCSNNVNCNGQNVMSTVGTISNCIQTVARWDQGFTEPTYSNNFGGQW